MPSHGHGRGRFGLPWPRLHWVKVVQATFMHHELGYLLPSGPALRRLGYLYASSQGLEAVWLPHSGQPTLLVAPTVTGHLALGQPSGSAAPPLTGQPSFAQGVLVRVKCIILNHFASYVFVSTLMTLFLSFYKRKICSWKTASPLKNTLMGVQVINFSSLLTKRVT